ncbi:hypothetical protein Tco_0412585 [Tanacetum coccineum]
METKDTLSSCSDSDEMEMQRLQKKARIMKDSCQNGISALKSRFTLLSKKYVPGVNESEFEHAFSHIFGEDVHKFTKMFSQNITTLETQLTNETLHESNCKTAFRLLKTPFEKIFTSKLIKSSQLDGYRRIDSGKKNDCSKTGNYQSLKNQSNISGDESSMSRNECNDKSTSGDDTDTELEKYKAFNDRTIDYDKLECKLKETQAVLAQKEHDIKEGLKLKAYEISVVKEKHDELVKQSLLTKSNYECLVKEKNKVIKDLKLKEENDIDKLITMEKQLKFLIEIVYKRNQSIQTIHMLAPKGSKYNGRPTFANPMYLKKAQSENPCLYEIPYDTSDLANRFAPDREETLTIKQESILKLNKDLVKLYDYTKQNSLYEVFKPPTQKELDQLCFAKLEKHSISLELVLQQCQEQMKNDTVCKEKKSIVFIKEREQYFKIQDLKAQLQDKNIVISELKKLIKKMKCKAVDTIIEKQSILGKPPLQPIRNQPVVRQPTAYKSERSQVAKHRFASQVDVSNNLTKPVTPHSWPPVRKLSFAKPYDVNAPSPSRKSPKHVSFQSPKESVGSNDIVHNYYLEEAKNKAQLQQNKALNIKPSVQQSTRLPNTNNGNKPKPRNFNQQPRNWPPSMSSHVSNRTVNIAEPPRNKKPFLKSKDLACPT